MLETRSSSCKRSLEPCDDLSAESKRSKTTREPIRTTRKSIRRATDNRRPADSTAGCCKQSSHCENLGLPESLMLRIFLLLSPTDLVAVSKVCKNWHKISHDASLWQDVDLTGIKLTLNSLWKFIRSAIAVHVRSLKFSGCNRLTLTPSFLHALTKQCPNLEALHVNDARMSDSASAPLIDKLPKTLKFLSLAHTVIGYDYLAPLKNRNVLPQLTGIDLSNSLNFCSRSRNNVPAVLSRTSLTSLRITNCFKLLSGYLNQIPQALPNLRELYANSIPHLDDHFLTELSTHCPQLVVLDLSNTHISNAGLLALAKAKLRQTLQRLNLCNTSVTDAGLEGLRGMVALRRLYLRQTKCTKQGCAALRTVLKECHIVSR